MSTDGDGKYLAVRNKWNASTKGEGDVLALRPVMDAIGLRFGASHLTIHDKLIVTEEPSALYYLRGFRAVFGGDDLHIVPVNGGKAIMPVLALVVGQGFAFKVVGDFTKHGKTDKQRIKDWGDIPDESICEIAIPSYLPDATYSGIEDVFSKADFKRLLTDSGIPPDARFDTMTNCAYVNLKDVIPKLILARQVSKNAGQYTPDNFDHETQANIRDLLAFRANADWFRM